MTRIAHILLCLLCPVLALAQSNYQYRYWFDEDLSNATTTTAGTSTQLQIDVSALVSSLHTLHMQVTDADGVSSPVHSRIFYIQANEPYSFNDGIRYWFDNDIERQQILNGATTIKEIDASNLDEGLHTLHVQTTGKMPSAIASKMFLKQRGDETVKADGIRYWFDQDVANQHILKGISNLTEIDTRSLAEGIHTLHVQVIGQVSSCIHSAMFMKCVGLTRYEYWVNQDYTHKVKNKIESNATTYELVAQLPVPSQPVRASDFHYEVIDSKPYAFANNDFNILFHDASGKIAYQSAKYTDYASGDDISQKAELLQSEKPVTKNKPAQEDIQWHHFPANVDDSVCFKVDCACTLQLFSPSGEEIYNASGANATKWGGLYVKEKGEYYLALHTVSSSQSTTKLEFKHIKKILGTVKAPTIAYANKTVTIACETAGAAIHYTIDGSVPTEKSPRYATPFTMMTPCTIKAVGILADYNNSEIATYELKECAAPEPVVNNNIVTIACATPGAVIRYTIDDSEPNASSTIYTAPITAGHNLTVKAYATCEGYIDSKTNSCKVESFAVKAPAIRYADKKVTITCETAGAKIHYTTNGSTPTSTSAQYSAPLAIDMPCVIKAIGFKDGYNVSEVATYDLKECAAPTITSNGNTVTISCTTAGAVIRYTTDGTEPTATSSIYTAPITVNRNLTVKAYATCEGCIDSRAKSYTFGAFTVKKPVIAYANKTVTITCETAGVNIYFTTNGSSPTSEATRYTAPFKTEYPCIIKAIGIMEGYNSSEVATYDLKECAAPTMTPSGNTITISCITVGAVIRYTTDGTEPNAASSIYTAPITVDRNLTIKAYATCEGCIDSKSNSYTIESFKVKTPSITYTGKAVTMTCETTEANIYYTTDGSTPTTASLQYTAPFAMTTPCIIKLIGIMDGYNNSEIATYDLKECAAPTITSSGNTVTISCTTTGAVIRYTTDDTEPNAASSVYTAPITVNRNLTVKAYATCEGAIDSKLTSHKIGAFTVSVPVITYANKMLTITCGTTGASIYYTTDGSTPTTASTLFNEPFTITTPCTINAIGIMEGYNSSEVVTYELKECAAPTITPSGNTVTISCATVGAVIRYTTDGTEPNAASSIYTAPITVSRNLTVKAYATCEGCIDSKITSCAIESFKVKTPSITYTGKAVTMTCETTEANIYYTTDGSTPTAASIQYTAPFAMTTPCIIKSIGIMDGYNNSEIATYDLKECAAPTIASSGNTVTISCATAGAVIRYTTDGTEPNAASSIYTAPITVNRNLTVKAYATCEGCIDSKTSGYTVGLFSVATPSISYSGRNVSITCETEDASIYYTLDGSTPTTASERYTDSFTMESPCTINAIGIMEGYNNSEVATYELMECAAPTFAAGSSTLSIYCETLGAVIRYTTDGTEPDETSTMYSTPIDIDRNLTVKAYATRNGYIDSQTSTYEVNSFAVATPVIAYSDGKVTITCGTTGAGMHYTLDGSTPTNTSVLYTGPFAMTMPCTIKAIGIMDGYSDSEVATYELMECDAPVITPTGNTVTISCTTLGAVIRYTTDGSEPDMASTIYTAPVTVDHNLTIKAYATLDGYIDSKTTTYTFGLFAVATPVISFSDKAVDMSCETEGADIYYTMDGSTPTSASARFTKPFTADKPCTIKAIGMMEGHNPSGVATFTLDACRPVTFGYDGRYVSLSSPDGVTIYYTTDGSEPTTASAKYTAPFDAGYMATIKGMADTRDSLSSETTSFTTEYHYNGYVAMVGKAGCLDKAFGWCGTDTVISLTVEGRLNAEDITALAAMPTLRHLDMAGVDMEEKTIANRSFAGSGLVSVSLPASLGSIGSNVFEGCRDMASITWNVDGMLPATAIDGISNPNLLIYVLISSYAPKKTNVVAGGTAAEVVLSDVADGGNFYCPQEFIAEKISYTHNYGMKTYIGKGAGWETLALPFDVQDITHETKGEMAPFAARRETAKPFWLYGFSAGGFERADAIKAYTPYIICMPNSTEYADEYNLDGNVTFSATKARVAVTRPNPSTKGNITLMPTTMAVQKSGKVCPINRNTEYNDFLPGEAFLAGLRDVTPFEAYIVNSNASKQNAYRIQDGIMGNYDDIEGIMASGMRIYSSNHVLYIDTDVERSANIYSMNGTLMKTVALSAGHNAIHGLSDGCYIVERRKVIVH